MKKDRSAHYAKRNTANQHTKKPDPLPSDFIRTFEGAAALTTGLQIDSEKFNLAEAQAILEHAEKYRTSTGRQIDLALVAVGDLMIWVEDNCGKEALKLFDGKHWQRAKSIVGVLRRIPVEKRDLLTNIDISRLRMISKLCDPEYPEYEDNDILYFQYVANRDGMNKEKLKAFIEHTYFERALNNIHDYDKDWWIAFLKDLRAKGKPLGFLNFKTMWKLGQKRAKELAEDMLARCDDPQELRIIRHRTVNGKPTWETITKERAWLEGYYIGKKHGQGRIAHVKGEDSEQEFNRLRKAIQEMRRLICMDADKASLLKQVDALEKTAFETIEEDNGTEAKGDAKHELQT